MTPTPRAGRCGERGPATTSRRTFSLARKSRTQPRPGRCATRQERFAHWRHGWCSLQSFKPFPALILRAGGNRCLCDRLILLAAAPADANGARDLSVHLDRDAACEDHHSAVVRYVNAEELVARLPIAAKLQRRGIEGLRGEGFVDGDVDAAKPRPVHAPESHEIGAGIDDRDIHRLADLFAF